MEDRYEIRGKIGQGGLGSVYRGYDTRMNREVAIKRISTSAEDPALQDESTRQLIKEAGALASLQHPHIVTVYDVGQDEDGPYVVMELISGKTLDELIEKAPLTWPDFRELALQTQEALIAAQELDLIHSDIKPSNLMLTWLPSGKFQVKIVDFGLATLTQSQSREELEELEAVFGSIFFMAPEQFERVPLDARSDLYSMGCVYYQALAGVYPFNGKTGQDVMQAHLHHTVKPLQEIRADIPLWVCDWIMWQINRYPQDRPESARQSLSVFLQNDKNPNPTMSLGRAQVSNAPTRQLLAPRQITPGHAPAAAAHTTAAATPQTRIQRPTPNRTVTSQVAPADANPAAEPQADAVADSAIAHGTAVHQTPPEDSGKTITAPQPLTPPEGFKPSVHTTSQDLPTQTTRLTTVTSTQHVHVRVPASNLPHAPAGKRKLTNNAKAAIAAILAVLVVLIAWYLLKLSGKHRETKLFNEMIAAAVADDASEVPVNALKLEVLLRAATHPGEVEQRQSVFKALLLAKATDDTEVDARIAEIATNQDTPPDVREMLIRDVLRKRKNPAVVPTLLAYASRSENDTDSAIAAIQAARLMAGEPHFGHLLQAIESAGNYEVRKGAEEILVRIIGESANREELASRLAAAYEESVNDVARHSLLRLLGYCGGANALGIFKNALTGDEQSGQIAAIVSLGSWPDDSAFSLLADFLAGNPEEILRIRAFDSALRLLGDSRITRTPQTRQKQWAQLATLAKSSDEQLNVIRGVANFDDEWAYKLIEGYKNSENERVVDVAEKSLERMNERRQLKGE